MKFPKSVVDTLLNLAEPPPVAGVEKLGNLLTLESKMGTVLVAPVGTTIDPDMLTEVFGDVTLVQMSATFYRLEKS